VGEEKVVGQGCHFGWFAKKREKKQERRKKRAIWPKFN
jgi:hypothetical protein